MNDEKMRQLIHTGIDRHCATLTSDPHRVQRVLNLAHETQGTGGIVVKKKLSIGFVMLLVFMFMSLTALAVALLTGTQIVEQFAVPMAQENDTATYTQESYTHEELVRLIKTLNENGFSLEEDSNIMRALQNGKGYWEEEVLMAICREAFGGNFSTWSIEEKHWFDNMTVQIGFKERNPYRIPGEGDMTLGIGFDEDSRAITFRMTDKGIPFDPLKKPDPDITLSAEDRQIGGLGIFIAKKTMTSITYSYENNENILTMIKKI